jgi:hypothetical protein
LCSEDKKRQQLAWSVKGKLRALNQVNSHWWLGTWLLEVWTASTWFIWLLGACWLFLKLMRTDILWCFPIERASQWLVISWNGMSWATGAELLWIRDDVSLTTCVMHIDSGIN